jgi:uncharacterized protein (TIRG00374 family)
MSVTKFALRIAIGAVMVAYLFFEHEVGNRTVFLRMLEIPVGALLLAMCLDLLGQTLSAYRWAHLSSLGGRPVQFGKVWSVYFSGMFFNMCLPTSIGGDVIRVVGLSRQTQSKSSAIASVFMDRNVGLGALLVLGLTSSAIMHSTIQATFFHQKYQLELWPLFALLLAGYIAANVALFSDSFCNLVTYCVNRVHLGFVGKKIEKLHSSVQAYRLPLTVYIWPFVLSLIYQFTEIALVWILARGLGIELSPLVFAALVTFQAVACLLPITVNGVGVREAIFCAVLMGHLGNTDYVKNEALALSLIFFGVMVTSSLLGGIVYLVSGMPRPSVAETEAVASGQ